MATSPTTTEADLMATLPCSCAACCPRPLLGAVQMIGQVLGGVESQVSGLLWVEMPVSTALSDGLPHIGPGPTTRLKATPGKAHAYSVAAGGTS